VIKIILLSDVLLLYTSLPSKKDDAINPEIVLP